MTTTTNSIKKAAYNYFTNYIKGGYESQANEYQSLNDYIKSLGLDCSIELVHSSFVEDNLDYNQIQPTQYKEVMIAFEQAYNDLIKL